MAFVVLGNGPPLLGAESFGVANEIITWLDIRQPGKVIGRPTENQGLRFFSKKWHRGDLDDREPEDRPAAYLAHIHALTTSLPTDALRLVENVSLHDRLIRRFEREGANLTLTVRAGDQQIGYFDASLRYFTAGLSSEDATFLAHASARRDVEILYDEFDSLGEAAWIHRFLFCPYHEIAVEFEAFKLGVVPVAGRLE